MWVCCCRTGKLASLRDRGQVAQQLAHRWLAVVSVQHGPGGMGPCQNRRGRWLRPLLRIEVDVVEDVDAVVTRTQRKTAPRVGTANLGRFSAGAIVPVWPDSRMTPSDTNGACQLGLGTASRSLRQDTLARDEGFR